MLKTFKKKEDVPKELAAKAIETKDGEWVADDESGEKTAKDVAKLTEALDKERESRENLEKELKTATKELKDLKRSKDASEKGITEEELDKIRKDEEKARQPLIDENEQLKARVKTLLLDDQLQKLGLEHGWMPERVKQAMKLARPRTDLSKDEKIIVLGEDGKVTAEAIEDFLKTTFKKENPFLYMGGPGPNKDAKDGPGPVNQPAADLVATRQVAKVAGSF